MNVIDYTFEGAFAFPIKNHAITPVTGLRDLNHGHTEGTRPTLLTYDLRVIALN
jgi:hypothetical protein